MDQEYKSGPIERGMKENGGLTKLMGKESFGMRMETFMRGIGPRTKLMGGESICIRTVRNMKDGGEMIFKMEKVKNLGLMALTTRENIKRE